MFFFVCSFALDNQFVYDQANVLTDEQEESIRNLLGQYEQATSNQFVIFTVESIGDETTIEELAVKTFEEWGIGQKGEDNGILILFSLNDRKVRTEVGYGLEGIIPDALAHRNAQNNGVPYFKEDNYALGLYAMTLGLIKIASPEFHYQNVNNVFSTESVVVYVFPEKPDPMPFVIDLENVLSTSQKSKLENTLKSIYEEEEVPFFVFVTSDSTKDFNYILKLTSEWEFPRYFEEGETKYEGVLLCMNFALQEIHSFDDYLTWLSVGIEEPKSSVKDLLDNSKPLEERVSTYCFALLAADNEGFKYIVYIFLGVFILMVIFVFVAVKWGGKGGSNNKNSQNWGGFSSDDSSSSSSSSGSSFGGGSSGGGGSTNSW